jgi:hypothetical protein
MTGRRAIGVTLALVALGPTGCGDSGDTPTERGDGGTLPTADPTDMTASEHREAACDEITVILRSVASGDPQVHGDQLDYIISHTGAGGDEALDDAANDWADGIADGDAAAVAAAARRLQPLC